MDENCTVKKSDQLPILSKDNLDMARILSVHGSAEDAYDIHQSLIPYGPLLMTLLGSTGFTISLLQKTALALVLSLCFLFFAALGLYRLLTQSSHQQATILRSDLMRVAEATIEMQKAKK